MGGSSARIERRTSSLAGYFLLVWPSELNGYAIGHGTKGVAFLRIVDAYVHLGGSCVYDLSIAASEIIESLNANRISAAVVAPFPGPPNPAGVHDDIASLASRFPGRLFGLANVNPHINRDAVYAEIERCVRQMGFVGVVLDTLGYAVNPDGNDGQTVFEIGRALSVPVVVHTGTGAPFGLPSAVLPRARSYSDVKVVLAHAGAGIYTGEALIVAQEASNVYVETSWCRDVDIRRLINELGANRVMIGADLPANEAVELSKYRSLGLHAFQQHQALGQTAVELFSLQGVPELPDPKLV